MPRCARRWGVGWRAGDVKRRIVLGCVRIGAAVARNGPVCGGISWDVYERGFEGCSRPQMDNMSTWDDMETPSRATSFPAQSSYTSLDDPPLRGGFCTTEGAIRTHPLRIHQGAVSRWPHRVQSNLLHTHQSHCPITPMGAHTNNAIPSPTSRHRRRISSRLKERRRYRA